MSSPLKSQFVAATYQVPESSQAAFLELQRGCETAMREQGLITERAIMRMRSLEDPELLLEMFEWVDEGAFGRAIENAKVQAFWGQYEDLWKEGGFGLERFPEAKLPWAQFAAIE